MSTQYSDAPEVRKIAEALIADVPDHKLLAGARIEYVFRDKASKRAGRVTLGSARRVGGLTAFLSAEPDAPSSMGEPAPFFVVEIAEDTWRRLSPEKRKALVDHELCHLHVEEDADGEPVLSTRGHDLEEFAGVVRRNGLWQADVDRFSKAVVEQLALAVDEVVSFVEQVGEDPDEPDAPPPVE